MPSHTIRFCKEDEYTLLVDFIRDHWREDHVFVKSKDMLDWQYLNKVEKKYNFIVAYNNETLEFDAILGYIPVSHFDSSLQDNKELWLAIWRLKDSANKQISGLNLLHFLRNNLRPTSIFAIGISAEVEKIYQIFGYDVSPLNHYYIKQNEFDEKIGRNLIGNTVTIPDNDFLITEVSIEDHKEAIKNLISLEDVLPRKSFKYYVNRYVNHEWFSYKFLGVFYKNQLKSIIVFREIVVENKSCLRIMDWIGEFPKLNLAANIQVILANYNAEYIDFLCKVPDESELLEMGFNKKNSELGQVLPEYFNPLVLNNVDITYAAKSPKNYRLMKGDSDQDRPNYL